MSNAHDQLKAEVKARLEKNTEAIAAKRQQAEALRIEIKELREAIEIDEKLDRALNPKPRKNTAQDLYGEDGSSEPDAPETTPGSPAPSFRPE